MSSAIGPGDWIECVGNWPGVGLAKGSVWLCNGIEFDPDPNVYCDLCLDPAQPTLFLQGWRPPRGYEGACACGFKPIHRPKSDLIEKLKQPAPDAVRELIAAD